ncbi:PTS sugar transporter subunit IIB [Klebsiella sp. BIGb0407]|uniref:PTS sugar transporter subunit IIB n=1 Tax=Klebsiella sp. BIGb0407 TaxID=2940603 RepID=UPI0021682815|nr:PTS sugar transporter subunit IIB [Klebsiella sp. BIGb0407]MCS3434280.1 PTS system cellobiose-specific IIB component [Klebsiella sp. BIGb0407]
MKKIMLCCSAGMSTSLLVKKMQEVAVEKGISVEIKAFGVAEFSEQVPNYDVVLLGPQIKYMLNDLSAKADVYGIKVQSIDMMDYGMLRGDKVLTVALELAK